MAAYNAAVADRLRPPQGVLFTLIAEYRASSDFTTLRNSTRRDYARYLKLIESEFGDMPIAAIPEARGVFKDWRDGMQATPRAADLAWSILARVLSVAADRGRIIANPCKGGGRLYKADRNDKIWTDAMIATASVRFPAHLRWVLILAVWTGQRQGDLLRLPWSAYDGERIRLRQSKGGRRVIIRASDLLRAELAGIPKVGPIMLTSSHGKPWTSDGFRSSWGRACDEAGIKGVTFHDLRGSAVTRLAEAGCTSEEIASITGHSLNDVNAMLDAHYLSRTQALSDGAILKLERRKAEPSM
jgi:integrase